MKEAYLYKKLKNAGAQCRNCAHYCVIEEGKKGLCRTRKNQKGKLYALNYGQAAACQIDPIEKKPLYHFLPGTYSLSWAAVGCNFRCLFCQNWEISQAKEIRGEDLSPEDIVKAAKKNKLPSISYTYTEPAVFSEYALETMKLAEKEGIKNIWVTNGFWSKELFDLISPHLDAVNCDLKSFEDEFYRKICGAKLQPVLDTLTRLKEKKVWIEITTLIVPTLNDKEEIFQKIAEFIKKELGPETPWHISQFFPEISWKLSHLPNTPPETLKKAYEIGRKTGLKYVYA